MCVSITIRYAARDINLYEFRPVGGGHLPRAEAGAHIDVHLPDRQIRQYSLVLGDNEAGYTIAVKREANGRGGSAYFHDTLRVGTELSISTPRNNFPLREDASHSVFLAGGIGITPIWSMVHRLRKIGASWALYFASRSPDDAAFAEELREHDNVHFHFDCENGGRPIDVDAIVAGSPADAEFYCCGPLPMLDAFERAMQRRPIAQKHVEYFAPWREAATGGFKIRIKSTGAVLDVPPDKSILHALLDAGLTVPFSCADGICGACETVVIDGIPDHRDLVLTEDERAQNRTMMVCCSGSHSDVLTLDL